MTDPFEQLADDPLLGLDYPDAAWVTAMRGFLEQQTPETRTGIVDLLAAGHELVVRFDPEPDLTTWLVTSLDGVDLMRMNVRLLGVDVDGDQAPAG